MILIKGFYPILNHYVFDFVIKQTKLSFSVKDDKSLYEIDNVILKIEKYYECGYKELWLQFYQGNQNCELAKKSNSKDERTVKWQTDELKDCRNMNFDMTRSIYVATLCGDCCDGYGSDFCKHTITVSLKNSDLNNSANLGTECVIDVNVDLITSFKSSFRSSSGLLIC